MAARLCVAGSDHHHSDSSRHPCGTTSDLHILLLGLTESCPVAAHSRLMDCSSLGWSSFYPGGPNNRG